MRTIYLGNFPVSATADDARELFGEFGAVSSVVLVTDRETGQSRGFGFVEMSAADATKAIEALDGMSYRDHVLRVNEARDRGARPPRRSW